MIISEIGGEERKSFIDTVQLYEQYKKYFDYYLCNKLVGFAFVAN